jgi:hypothetical protein
METKMGKCLHQKWETTSKVKIRFVDKIIMFEETLEFKQVILLCYGK